MSRHRTGRSANLAPAISAAMVLLLLPSCSASPSQDIMGSFFPSWLLCLGIGVVAALIVRQILSAVGIDGFVMLPLATYGAVALSVTFLVWLARFGD